MKILIAEDDVISRKVLQLLLAKWGYELVVTCDGEEAWKMLSDRHAPNLAILDWMMPGMEGVEICRRAREEVRTKHKYIILVTAKGAKADIIAGLQAGADDYLTKPINAEELHVRLQVGERILNLQQSLAERIRELESSSNHIKMLQGLLPICSYCKKIRNDQDYWEQMEGYISKHSDAVFSHSICPECYEKHAKPAILKIRENKKKNP